MSTIFRRLTLLLFLPAFLSGCSGSKSGGETAGGDDSTKDSGAKAAAVAPFVSPHRVMVSMASGESVSAGAQQYLSRLQERLARGWQPIPSNRQYSVAIEFTVTRPGLCSDPHTVSATCPKRAIEKTIDMIRMQAPFEALPEDFKDAPVTFRCDFVYLPQKGK